MDSVVSPASFAPEHSDRRLEDPARDRPSGFQIIRFFFLIYRVTIGPALRAFGSLGQECRFHPSCSQYSEEAFTKLPFGVALKLSVLRILRCNPWNSSAPHDPLPLMFSPRDQS